ncbi:hypothetical protein BVG16_22360 [Paenibacillus selenitireducens]|uniref:BMC domain-containing protein n=1 Tax=Paenibacillus selenitireducens TaxID=1324314 RepID=A0A1T2X6P1_9BACL|nr:BMC domain-containing protein [Paenibacillus selenitireducens]OPA75336.1 hypothetical protein BVG16_22360 [Paenibacillus selenitireducens]
MKNKALGLVEVKGYLGAIAAADAALKTASVTCVGLEIINGGLVTVKITGDVGAVQAAVEAGAETAAQMNVLWARHVIARVHEETASIVNNSMNDDVEAEAEETAEETAEAAEVAVPKDSYGANADSVDVKDDAIEVEADSVEEKADAVCKEKDTAKSDVGEISVDQPVADVSEMPVQAVNKSTSQIIAFDLPKEQAQEQAGSPNATSGMKSRKPVAKPTNRTSNTKKARM